MALGIAAAVSGFTRGFEEGEREIRQQRAENLRAWAAFKEMNPDASASDFIKFRENLTGGKNWLNNALPTDTAIEAMTKQRAQLLKDQADARADAQFQRTERLKEATRRTVSDIMNSDLDDTKAIEAARKAIEAQGSPEMLAFFDAQIQPRFTLDRQRMAQDEALRIIQLNPNFIDVKDVINDRTPGPVRALLEQRARDNKKALDARDAQMKREEQRFNLQREADERQAMVTATEATVRRHALTFSQSPTDETRDAAIKDFRANVIRYRGKPATAAEEEAFVLSLSTEANASLTNFRLQAMPQATARAQSDFEARNKERIGRATSNEMHDAYAQMLGFNKGAKDNGYTQAQAAINQLVASFAVSEEQVLGALQKIGPEKVRELSRDRTPQGFARLQEEMAKAIASNGRLVPVSAAGEEFIANRTAILRAPNIATQRANLTEAQGFLGEVPRVIETLQDPTDRVQVLRATAFVQEANRTIDRLRANLEVAEANRFNPNFSEAFITETRRALEGAENYRAQVSSFIQAARTAPAAPAAPVARQDQGVPTTPRAQEVNREATRALVGAFDGGPRSQTSRAQVAAQNLPPETRLAYAAAAEVSTGVNSVVGGVSFSRRDLESPAVRARVTTVARRMGVDEELVLAAMREIANRE